MVFLFFGFFFLLFSLFYHDAGHMVWALKNDESETV